MILRWINHFALMAGLAATIPVACAAAPSKLSASPMLVTKVETVRKTGLTVMIGKGRLLHLSEPSQTIVVADPAVADAKALAPELIWVFGKSVGETKLTAVPANGSAPATIALTTVRNPAPAQSAATEADPLRHQSAPQLNFAGNRLVLSGHFTGLGGAETMTRVVRPFTPPKTHLLDLGTMHRSPQVTLHVQIAEVSRSALRQLGVNWNVLAHPGRFTASLLTGTTLGQALGAVSFGAASVGYQSGSVSVNSLINALAQHGALRMLAEPNLTTLSGEDASFLAGGQIPVPVPQSFGVTTIAYKTYGVSLDFIPTLLAGGRIALHVRPEVSAISTANSVTIGGVSVPAFTVERADTNIEMASGQTVAIAGLFQKSQDAAINGIPALGNLPVLGPLFKSTEFQDNQTELVILITPYLTRPVGRKRAFALPTQNLRAALVGDAPVHGRVRAGFGVN